VPPEHLLGPRAPRDGIVVRGTEKKFDDTGRFDHIAFAATDLAGVRKRLASKKVKFREQVVPRTGAAQIFLYDPDGVGVELNFPPEEARASCWSRSISRRWNRWPMAPRSAQSAPMSA
jgi:hypothetical protein